MHSCRKKFCCNLFEVIPYIYWTNRDSDIFIGGDINVDMLQSNSTNAKRIQKLIRINQLKQLIHTTTRLDSNTCLELIITDCDIVKQSGIENINISDHLPVFLYQEKG